MRVLHIIGSMDPLTGGPCQGIRTSSAVLETLNVCREVVCFDSRDASYLGMDSFPVHALGKRQGLWQYNPNLIPWLREHLHRFDVVVTNGLWIHHSNAVRQEIAMLKRQSTANVTLVPKWFVMPHGMLDPYFQRAKNRKIKAIRNWFYWKLIEHRVVAQADGLLFTCETELLLARETFKPYRPKREVNVGYGIENPPVYTKAMREAFLAKCPDINDQPFLLFLSRIHAKKGIDLLLDAYISLCSEMTNFDKPIPKLVVAGPGIDTDFGKSILKLARKNPVVWANIHFTGMLAGDAKWGAFYGCEGFVLPSHQENFGIAVAEALACSKPVLISNQVNIWREIEMGKGGLVSESTLSGTRQLLQRWIALSSSSQKKMGEDARSTFERYFAVEPAARRFKDAIQLDVVDKF